MYTYEEEDLLQDRWNYIAEYKKINLIGLSHKDRLAYERNFLLSETEEFRKALSHSIHDVRGNLGALITSYQLTELAGDASELEGGLMRANLVLNPIRAEIKCKQSLHDSYLYGGRLAYNIEVRKR